MSFCREETHAKLIGHKIFLIFFSQIFINITYSLLFNEMKLTINDEHVLFNVEKEVINNNNNMK